MTEEPVSWLMIKPGWTVAGSDGEEIGRVSEVIGDSTHDIWDGLAVASGMLARPKYVAAEQVGSIVDGTVTLAMTQAQFEALGEYEEPPTSAEIEPEKASVVTRAEGWVEAPERDRPEHMSIARRILHWFGLERD
ncbi:MAG TPA: PRC-barrel domain-containing protein [Gaiellaceae bacterium]|nr:PRC-barrel domain-containing protein [Gaiellaceae bacterium]